MLWAIIDWVLGTVFKLVFFGGLFIGVVLLLTILMMKGLELFIG